MMNQRVMKKMSRVFYETCKLKFKKFQEQILKSSFFKDFSRTTYNSRTIQGIQRIQKPLTTLSNYNT